MSNTAIKVENLSKIYRLGEIGTGTISRDMERWFKTRILKQEDPFLKIGETNDRANKGASDIVYSLQDINFEINQGDAVGIIGRNGAGKSTLLKILSRVTTPTTGKINIKGRVASLLEVGTGFHPELTGRENIYLNGAILGMRKREIDRKLDEIIDFSGVERYIDTPVKRYSSGMYVRLAFAVAAHLESEILIVDEVLAVGDAEFQKKCLGKMGEVSKGEGRTVLFVSHNLASVAQLCSKGLLIENGIIRNSGELEKTLELYTNNFTSELLTKKKWFDVEFAPGNENIKLNEIEITGIQRKEISTGDGFSMFIDFRNYKTNTKIGFNLQLLTLQETIIFTSGKIIADGNSKDGNYKLKLDIPELYLNQGFYKLKFFFGERGVLIADFNSDEFVFEVHPNQNDFDIDINKLPGLLIPKITYKLWK
jgi:lipopolysaccharide transport system ATP-binding protein